MTTSSSTRAERAYQQAIKLIITLEEAGYSARLVGGCVRDRQLGLVPKDFDIATSAQPEEVAILFASGPWKVVPTGIAHGTLTIVTKSGPMEVTTLRKDKETDGRHAVVEYGASFEEDAARRDFTINAMSEDRHGQIFDYFSGRKDLKEGILRFVGDAEERIREDFLRIMRYFRFWSRFSLRSDDEAAQAIKKRAPDLIKVSQERITSEFLQILATDKPETVVTAMADWGVLRVIMGPLPFFCSGLSDNPWHKPRPEVALFRLCLLLGAKAGGGEIESLAGQFRLANKQKKILLCYLVHGLTAPEEAASPAVKMGFWDKTSDLLGDEDLIARSIPVWQRLFPDLKTRWADLERCEVEKGWLRRQKLPITGHDVAAQLKLEGAALGAVMAQLLEGFRNGLFYSRDEALAFLGRHKGP